MLVHVQTPSELRIAPRHQIILLDIIEVVVLVDLDSRGQKNPGSLAVGDKCARNYAGWTSLALNLTTSSIGSLNIKRYNAA